MHQEVAKLLLYSDLGADSILIRLCEIYHDWETGCGEKPQQAPFGKGEMDIKTILSKIKAHDENAVLTLEGTTGADIAHADTTIKEIWESV